MAEPAPADHQTSVLLEPNDGARPTVGALVPRPELHLGYHFAVGAAAAVIVVPSSLYLGALFAGLSNNYLWSAIPVLLSIGLLPPLAVTLATVIAGNWGSPGRYRAWPAFFATLLINGISLACAASLGLTVGIFSEVAIYTLVQAVLQPGAAVLLERGWPREPPLVLTVRDPIAPTTFVAPAAKWSF
ncbi:MAG: hypothetical protein IPJ65_02515 [Archangiaceae bacterium]|nr:hypothetical protein [Archangiaceae bacterium]